ncbi:hypothetical protein ABH930_004480 [Kitasatospora sp. GAS204A]|uniref:hypothetical protein n=1 Tax=unclassified Kitasatospora TaxID=2633591 RepID=UPI002473C8D1|nr:hypothetical protein [Kitasatospora sp. GAS204B]MDH6119719.1 hypothetical protein [Kitasatospora sp. GAS204B]
MAVFARTRSVSRRRKVAAVAALLLTAVTAGSATSATAAPMTGHAGLTWITYQQRSNGEVHVGFDGTSNPWVGDTPASAVLPMLCLDVTNSPLPADLNADFYDGWARGWVGLTPPITGYSLTSRATANALCASDFGPGWREAGFHDGHYGTDLTQVGGWSFWARGTIASGVRFWVANNDQPANPWN